MRYVFVFLVTNFLLVTTGIADTKEEDGLNVFVCGSSSPLADLNRAKVCIAVYTDKHYFLFDTGAGSGGRLAMGQLPSKRLDGVFLTHFHSDHISDIYNINLTSWASGRQYPLPVYGPKGVNQVIDGMNTAYAIDRGYRVAHHGKDLLNPDHGLLKPNMIDEGVVFNSEGLSITAFAVNHSPIEPAFGYRIDYKGRSVVISGDTVVAPKLFEAAKGVDLLLHDALSIDMLSVAIKMAKKAGNEIRAKIITDVTDYHAHTTDVANAAELAGVKQLAFYHMVPPPRNDRAKAIFMRGVPKEVIVTEDMMRFTLPVDSSELIVTNP